MAGDEAGGAAALAREEERAARENDEEWAPEQQRLEERREAMTEREATAALDRLLAKAEKYTQFLNRKLMVVAENEQSRAAARKTAGGTLAPADDAPRKRRKLDANARNGKRVVAASAKGGLRAAAAAAVSGDRAGDNGDGADVHDDDEDEESGASSDTAAPASEVDDAEADAVEQPKLLTGGKLRNYQVRGYQWMVGLYENGLHGILADEMGLGKTVQTIALIAHLREKGVFGPFLIVVPLSTIANWVSEVQRWAPDMPVLLYHGTKEERAEMRHQHLKPARRARDMSAFPITVTTYDIVCRDRKDLQACQWKHVIVDEGHRLKNFRCRLIRELNQICGGSVLRGGANKILLTGTPLQNNLSELWSLLNFLMPEIFDDLEFFQSVFAFDGVGSSAHDERLLRKHQEGNIVSKLHKILAPFMMRRLKSEVAKSLPSKKEVVVYVPMTPPQREMYQSIVKGELAGLLEQATGSKTQLNNILMQLRKCSLHPFLHFEPKDAHGNHITDQTLIDASGKLRLLDMMLRELKDKGHKVLIFSQFTSLLDILTDYLEVLRPSWKFCRIDGTTKLGDRRQQMDDFNSDPDHFCFLLSTRSGGVGINLMSADTVIIFDSDWNPHQDNQAQDRAHRIGQKKDVMVYRLITSRSVELKILERANSKRKLERVVCAKQATMSQDGKPSKAMDVNELRRLLEDDFKGHASDVGEISDATMRKLLDRSKVISGEVASSGKGYEIVEHKASSIVGAVHE